MIPIAKPVVSEEGKRMVLEVLESGELASGRKVKEFEERFSSYIGQKYGIAVSSGTTALHIALQACGIKFGDKVITTPFTFIATANSILYCAAKPVFCDIDENTFNISISSLKKLLETEKDVKALLIVHLFGLPCNMDEIMEITNKYGLILIEDCAQAHGASFKGKKAGSFGLSSIFSFYPTKNMTTSEGGMIVTNDEKVSGESMLLRNHGMKNEYEHEILGYNFRMTNISAAIGLSQMKQLDELIEKRRKNAHYFNEHLKNLPGIEIPFVPSSDYLHAYNQYTLRIKDKRDDFIKNLKEKEIGHKIFYPTIIPNQPFYRKLGVYSGSFPVAEKVSKEVISIPVHPALHDSDLKRIVESVSEYCKCKK